ncbi:hypothetical protein C8A03DRAFT_36062, partial [Achaetomium macrosporum]
MTEKLVPEREAHGHFEEHPRTSALEWAPMPHEEIEAEEHSRRLLGIEQDRLFSKSNHNIEVLESNPAPGKGDGEYSFASVDELWKHLAQRPAPLIRHVFVEADDSHSPLNCSMSMLKCVFTYAQIPPPFLRAVYAFGSQEEEPTDAGLVGFGCDSAVIRRYPSGAKRSPYDHGEALVAAKALKTALATHPVYLSWRRRHWDRFIQDMRSNVGAALDGIATVPVDSDLNALTDGYALLTLRDAGTVMRNVEKFYMDAMETVGYFHDTIPTFRFKLEADRRTLVAAEVELKFLLPTMEKGIEF